MDQESARRFERRREPASTKVRADASAAPPRSADAARARLVDVVLEHSHSGGRWHDAAKAAIFTDILARLPSRDRLEIAKRFGASLSIPLAIVRLLAHDDPAIACQVLHGNPQLDADTQLAIAAGNCQELHARLAGALDLT